MSEVLTARSLSADRSPGQTARGVPRIKLGLLGTKVADVTAGTGRASGGRESAASTADAASTPPGKAAIDTRTTAPDTPDTIAHEASCSSTPSSRSRSSSVSSQVCNAKRRTTNGTSCSSRSRSHSSSRSRSRGRSSSHSREDSAGSDSFESYSEPGSAAGSCPSSPSAASESVASHASFRKAPGETPPSARPPTSRASSPGSSPRSCGEEAEDGAGLKNNDAVHASPVPGPGLIGACVSPIGQQFGDCAWGSGSSAGGAGISTAKAALARSLSQVGVPSGKLEATLRGTKRTLPSPIETSFSVTKPYASAQPTQRTATPASPVRAAHAAAEAAAQTPATEVAAVASQASARRTSPRGAALTTTRASPRTSGPISPSAKASGQRGSPNTSPKSVKKVSPRAGGAATGKAGVALLSPRSEPEPEATTPAAQQQRVQSQSPRPSPQGGRASHQPSPRPSPRGTRHRSEVDRPSAGGSRLSVPGEALFQDAPVPPRPKPPKTIAKSIAPPPQSTMLQQFLLRPVKQLQEQQQHQQKPHRRRNGGEGVKLPRLAEASPEPSRATAARSRRESRERGLSQAKKGTSKVRGGLVSGSPGAALRSSKSTTAATTGRLRQLVKEASTHLQMAEAPISHKEWLDEATRLKTYAEEMQFLLDAEERNQKAAKNVPQKMPDLKSLVDKPRKPLATHLLDRDRDMQWAQQQLERAKKEYEQLRRRANRSDPGRRQKQVAELQALEAQIKEEQQTQKALQHENKRRDFVLNRANKDEEKEDAHDKAKRHIQQMKKEVQVLEMKNKSGQQQMEDIQKAIKLAHETLVALKTKSATAKTEVPPNDEAKEKKAQASQQQQQDEQAEAALKEEVAALREGRRKHCKERENESNKHFKNLQALQERCRELEGKKRKLENQERSLRSLLVVNRRDGRLLQRRRAESEPPPGELLAASGADGGGVPRNTGVSPGTRAAGAPAQQAQRGRQPAASQSPVNRIGAPPPRGTQLPSPVRHSRQSQHTSLPQQLQQEQEPCSPQQCSPQQAGPLVAMETLDATMIHMNEANAQLVLAKAGSSWQSDALVHIMGAVVRDGSQEEQVVAASVFAAAETAGREVAAAITIQRYHRLRRVRAAAAVAVERARAQEAAATQAAEKARRGAHAAVTVQKKLRQGSTATTTASAPSPAPPEETTPAMPVSQQDDPQNAPQAIAAIADGHVVEEDACASEEACASPAPVADTATFVTEPATTAGGGRFWWRDAPAMPVLSGAKPTLGSTMGSRKRQQQHEGDDGSSMGSPTGAVHMPAPSGQSPVSFAPASPQQAPTLQQDAEEPQADESAAIEPTAGYANQTSGAEEGENAQEVQDEIREDAQEGPRPTETEPAEEYEPAEDFEEEVVQPRQPEADSAEEEDAVVEAVATLENTAALAVWEQDDEESTAQKVPAVAEKQEESDVEEELDEEVEKSCGPSADTDTQLSPVRPSVEDIADGESSEQSAGEDEQLQYTQIVEEKREDGGWVQREPTEQIEGALPPEEPLEEADEENEVPIASTSAGIGKEEEQEDDESVVESQATEESVPEESGCYSEDFCEEDLEESDMADASQSV